MAEQHQEQPAPGPSAGAGAAIGERVAAEQQQKQLVARGERRRAVLAIVSRVAESLSPVGPGALPVAPPAPPYFASDGRRVDTVLDGLAGVHMQEQQELAATPAVTRAYAGRAGAGKFVLCIYIYFFSLSPAFFDFLLIHLIY